MQATIEQIEKTVKQLSKKDLRKVRALVDSLLENEKNEVSDDLRLRKMREYVDSVEDKSDVRKSVREAGRLRENLTRNYE